MLFSVNLHFHLGIIKQPTYEHTVMLILYMNMNNKLDHGILWITNRILKAM